MTSPSRCAGVSRRKNAKTVVVLASECSLIWVSGSCWCKWMFFLRVMQTNNLSVRNMCLILIFNSKLIPCLWYLLVFLRPNAWNTELWFYSIVDQEICHRIELTELQSVLRPWVIVAENTVHRPFWANLCEEKKEINKYFCITKGRIYCTKCCVEWWKQNIVQSHLEIPTRCEPWLTYVVYSSFPHFMSQFICLSQVFQNIL